MSDLNKINKLECTCIEAYKSRKMRDPNCCACSCDHNELVEQLEKANERLAEVERERDWLLGKVGVDEGGVYIPCGNSKSRMGESLSYLRKQLNEGE